MKLPSNQHRSQSGKSEKASSHLEQINHNAAGIDLGGFEHWVCVAPDKAEKNVRRFGCFTPDLMAMADWLMECGVTTVAMEATGVYWIPVFQILEARGLQVRLVNAHYVKTVPGRKTDVNDCFEPRTVTELPKTQKKRRKKSTANHPNFDLRSLLYRMVGIDFTLIDGLDAMSVQNILSEVGLDPKRFPTVKHFTSWLGLCPGQKITGGKVKSSKTRPVVNRAANAFRLAALSLTQSRSALGAFYRRLRSRLGAPKAITATAHKLARMFYCMWTTTGLYADPGLDYYEKKYSEQVLKNLRKKAHALGLELVALPQEPPLAPSS